MLGVGPLAGTQAAERGNQAEECAVSSEVRRTGGREDKHQKMDLAEQLGRYCCLFGVKHVDDHAFPLKPSVAHELPGSDSYPAVHDGS
ncbi:unnamed protein product [Rangifer tarandus platyrhynchus]|uniref:Uncharacterized protein n=1 Tax=Rangifer tarandus platyrhynchus TaxID=3082113 RepID=A0ABN8ZGR5_RANTA|nr:unnamed protein product [Rangifer tarandus platyrhynchus]